jgi:anti-sigma B factor antagonist
MNYMAAVRKVGDVVIVDLSGNLTMAAAPGLICGTVADAIDMGARNILLNLAQVTHLDSAAGMGELVSSYEIAVRQGAQLKLLHAGKNIDHVLHLTCMHTIFDTYDDEAVAIGSFQELSSTV